MNSKKDNKKTSFQIMKEFANDDLEDCNNDKEILSLDYNKGLIEILNKENKMQVNIKEYKKLKSKFSESILKDIYKFKKKDSLGNHEESGKGLIENTLNNNNNNFSSKYNNKLLNKAPFFINTDRKVKYKLNVPCIKTEINNKNVISISEKKKGLYDEEIKLIIKKKNLLLNQNKINKYKINIFDQIINNYEQDPSNINKNKFNIMDLLDNICYKIYKNDELCFIGNDFMHDYKYNERDYRNEFKKLKQKIKILENKILAVINTKLEVNLNGNEIKINLNGKNVGDFDLSLLCSIEFKNLLEIDLGNNNISNLEEINNWNFPHLKKLNLSHNKIKNIEPLKKLPSINFRCIDLSFNKIENINPIGEMIKRNRHLEEINLKNNKIKNVEILKNNIPYNMKEVNLDNNNILKKDFEEITNIINNNITKIEEHKQKNNFIIYKKKNNNSNIRLFNQKFIEKNKEKCKLMINRNEKELIEFYKFKNDEDEIKVEILMNENLVDMSYMFSDCSSLFSLKGISNLNTKNVINMSNMFSGCSSLESLEGISNWKTDNVIDMSNMFYGCSSLLSLEGISDWQTKNVTTIFHIVLDFGQNTGLCAGKKLFLCFFKDFQEFPC